MRFLSFLRRDPKPAPPEPAAAAPVTAPAAGDAAPANMTSAELSPEERALEALRGVDDPEVGINVADLGHVYGLEIDADSIGVRLALTSPSCPLGDHIAGEAETALRRVFPDLARIDVAIVHRPPWGPERISENGRRQLGWR
jgi:metal-sulfur cluster biosynthetic enzyme